MSDYCCGEFLDEITSGSDKAYLKQQLKDLKKAAASKNETMNETLRKEIHTNSLSLAEIRGFLRRDKRWGG